MLRSDASELSKNMLTSCAVHGTDAISALGMVTMAIDPDHAAILGEEVRQHVSTCQRCTGLVMTGLLGVSVILLSELYVDRELSVEGENARPVGEFWRELIGDINALAYKEDTT